MAEKQTPAPVEEPERKPRFKRLLALGGLSLLGSIVGVAWLFGYWEPRLLPVRMIEVEGEVHSHSSDRLRQIIGERLRGGILTADLQALKAAAEELPWVGSASLRRVWPDRLQVRVEEHHPIARWNAEGLVTARGVVFNPGTGTVPAGLPMLEGDDKRAPVVVGKYQQWRDELMLVGHLIQSLSVDARGAWRVDLVSGTRLELGTDHVEQRLARFIGSASQLDAAGQAEVVDLRYSNGFVVKWAPSAEAQARADTDRERRSEKRG